MVDRDSSGTQNEKLTKEEREKEGEKEREREGKEEREGGRDGGWWMIDEGHRSGAEGRRRGSALRTLVSLEIEVPNRVFFYFENFKLSLTSLCHSTPLYGPPRPSTGRQSPSISLLPPFLFSFFLFFFSPAISAVSGYTLPASAGLLPLSFPSSPSLAPHLPSSLFSIFLFSLSPTLSAMLV